MTTMSVMKHTRNGKTIYRTVSGEEYYKKPNGQWLHLENGKPDRTVVGIEFLIAR